MKHTPGPWVLLDNEGDIVIADRPGEGLYTLASTKNHSPRGSEKLANAKLIAAAPDLLEALESICTYGADTLSGRSDGGLDDRKWQRDAVKEMTRRAREALDRLEKTP
jgi:hypothetical protein